MTVEPVKIEELSETEIAIDWSDGSQSLYTADQLRRLCPCAGCVNEWTGERMLDPASIADDITFENMSLTGRYALNFRFSDGHETGI
jgi:DUF971 family protein